MYLHVPIRSHDQYTGKDYHNNSPQVYNFIACSMYMQYQLINLCYAESQRPPAPKAQHATFLARVTAQLAC